MKEFVLPDTKLLKDALREIPLMMLKELYESSKGMTFEYYNQHKEGNQKHPLCYFIEEYTEGKTEDAHIITKAISVTLDPNVFLTRWHDDKVNRVEPETDVYYFYLRWTFLAEIEKTIRSMHIERTLEEVE